MLCNTASLISKDIHHSVISRGTKSLQLPMNPSDPIIESLMMNCNVPVREVSSQEGDRCGSALPQERIVLDVALERVIHERGGGVLFNVELLDEGGEIDGLILSGDFLTRDAAVGLERVCNWDGNRSWDGEKGGSTGHEDRREHHRKGGRKLQLRVEMNDKWWVIVK